MLMMLDVAQQHAMPALVRACEKYELTKTHFAAYMCECGCLCNYHEIIFLT